MPKRILVIDDAEKLRRAVEKALSLEGFTVLSAASGTDGLALAQESPPDLVLTDADLPGLDGHALCRALKKGGATRGIPVIIMSGQMVAEQDVVSGLEGGADDYVIKPFTMKILLARINAVLRRYGRPLGSDGLLKRGGIELDPAAREVRVAGRAVALTRKEFDLLALFLERPGRVHTVNGLLETIWGYDVADYNDPQTVQTHVSRLRRKLGPQTGDRIVNVHGLGYKFEE
ncbi:MAG: hypothetical protein A2X36_13655 [Elusimicrobia bacterium GWA2_69_24]|nr:MAG: hypothetical protein A2X36_13655 [Elusimicrobia bacterium GWA2_69_24]